MTFDAAATRLRLWKLLGDIPAPFAPAVELLSTREEAAYTLEHFRFRNGLDDTVYAYLLIPRDIDLPAPAVVYHHEHGGKYTLGKEAALRIRENGYAPGSRPGGSRLHRLRHRRLWLWAARSAWDQAVRTSAGAMPRRRFSSSFCGRGARSGA